MTNREMTLEAAVLVRKSALAARNDFMFSS